MTTISPTTTKAAGALKVTWAAAATADTIEAIEANGTTTLAGSIAFTGTFGGATVKLQESNDNTNWFDVGVVTGSMVNVTATAAGLFNFSSASRYLCPKITGGTGDSITATMMLRG